MTDVRHWTVGYVAGLTVAVGALVGVLTRMSIPLDVADSTVEARVAALLVVVSILVLVACYVLLPVGVATARARRDGRLTRHGGLAALAIFGPPLVIFRVFHAFEHYLLARPILPFLGTVAVLAIVTTGLVVAGALDHLPLASRLEPSAWPGGLNVAVIVFFAVGFLAVQPVAGPFAMEHTDTYGGFNGSDARFEVKERTVGNDTLLTFTHEDGGPLHAERLYVRGEGFTDVEGTDHTGPGVWRGTVGGERPRRGGPAVVAGDSVTVGTTQNCSITLVYESGDERSFVDGHRCGVPRRSA